ncbi:DNA primase [Mergibacter septicus]|uniref:DNA primase n=1 Tax=Mergibacter septicus TaxID=221402 RepID=UPI0011797F02|nr:DNA primase [Mergibacter septicus]AWX14566.1 DNA primase [Mergibacter septicus]
MKGLIPRTFIDDLLAKTDIVDVVNSRIKTKKAGSEFHACCPFHNEKTPSFTVSQKKQFYHCFGCGAHGNAIGFLMAYDNLDYVEAIEELASMKGLEVPRESRSNFDQKNNKYKPLSYKRDLYQLLQAVADFYHQNLSSNIPAQAYLQERGLSAEVIQRFNLGFASNSVINSSESILHHFGTNQEEREKLQESGMLSKNERGKVYDRFRNRIMFPIRDRRGRTIAFGGRVLGDEKPKYLNSPETGIYHKGSELYGLFEALEQNKNPDYLLVVEGYMDVVALAQFGVYNAVASLGTATTGEQLQLAFRATEQIICCYDGDRAGRAAAWRALENALPHLYDGRQLKFIFLPDGEDPDTFIRKSGKDGFEQYLEQAQSLSDFFFRHLLEQVDLSSKEGKAKLLALAQPLLAKIPGEMLQLYLRNILAQKLGILEPSQLDKLLHTPPPTQTNTEKGKLAVTPMRLLVGLLLQNPELVEITKSIPDLQSLTRLNEAGMDLFLQLVSLCQERVGITTGQLLEYWRGTKFEKSLEILSCWDHLISEDNIEITFRDTLIFFYTRLVEQRIATLIAKDRSDMLSIEEKWELVELLKQGT